MSAFWMLPSVTSSTGHSVSFFELLPCNYWGGLFDDFLLTSHFILCVHLKYVSFFKLLPCNLLGGLFDDFK